ncbi:class I adenylate-forming enzyme family protein [Burkholderia sp. LMG 21824]|uniref:class I adenylate-forming enzyme family protein n=1 Tax=Burkholderia sp. LMG 21824 TaxID=3158172 RepID=UPI003C2E1A46
MKLISLIASARGERGKAMLTGKGGVYASDDLRGAVALTIRRWQGAGIASGQRILLIADHDEQALFALAAASALGLQVVMPYNLADTAVQEWQDLHGLVRPDHVLYVKSDPVAADALQARGIASLRSRVDPASARAARHDSLVVAAPDPVEHFLMLFSSGTTARPKAISISEALICRRIASVTRRLSFRADSRIFQSGLMNNTTGIIFSFGSVLHGASLFYPEGRDVSRWPAQMARLGITHAMLRPVTLQRFLNAMVRDDVRLEQMQVMAYGAAPLPLSVLEEARRRIGCDWVQGYGLSETFGPFCWLTESDHRMGLPQRQLHCVGRPDDTLEVALRDGAAAPVPPTPGAEGEVVLRGDGLMAGYFDAGLSGVEPLPEWFPTGDYACIGPDGEWVLKGRISESLLTPNGHRIYPEEVEGVLAAVPGIGEVVLAGWPACGGFGEHPVACIYPNSAADTPDALLARIRSRLRQTLSEEKWPSFLFVSAAPFPRNANDKIVRRAVAGALVEASLITIQMAEMNHATV